MHQGFQDLNRFRSLDFDDLLLLKHLLEGESLTSIARNLCVTQPAISQRMRKLEWIYGIEILERFGRSVRLTGTGRAICTRAAAALSQMY